MYKIELDHVSIVDYKYLCLLDWWQLVVEFAPLNKAHGGVVEFNMEDTLISYKFCKYCFKNYIKTTPNQA